VSPALSIWVQAQGGARELSSRVSEGQRHKR
jgi:hypothetical protein